MRFLHRLPAILGYLVYTLLVAGILLWYMFPAAALQRRLEFELGRRTPGFAWEVRDIGLALPGGVRAGKVKVVARDRSNLSLDIDDVVLYPDLGRFWREKTLSASYRLQFLQGTVSGKISADRKLTTLGFEGKIQGVHLEKSTALQRRFDRRVDGKLSGSFSGSCKGSATEQLKLQGSIRVDQGHLGLQGQVLGLTKLDFTRASSRFSYNKGKLVLKEGKVASSLLTSLFSGSVLLAFPVEQSVVQLEGDLIPRPEFLATVADAATAAVLKKEMQDGRLSFTVNGTLKKPGIFFPGMPSGLARYLRGGGRQQ